MKFLIFSFTFLLSSTLFSQETFSTTTFEKTRKMILGLTKDFKPHEVLIVHDIDNTILAHKHPLGSDQWFRWQMGLLNTRSPYLTGKNFEEILYWYNQAIKAPQSTMRLTDQEIHKILRYYKFDGFDLMGLTARNPGLIRATWREIKRNRVFLVKSPPLPKNVISGNIPEFERPVFYANGLAFISGQDKGLFLRYLLQKSSKNYKAIVIIDDQEKNVRNVHQAFEKSSVKTIGFHFLAEEKNVKAFERLSKRKVHQDFLKLKKSCDLKFL